MDPRPRTLPLVVATHWRDLDLRAGDPRRVPAPAAALMGRPALDANAPPDRLWEEVGRLQQLLRRRTDQRDAALSELQDVQESRATAGLLEGVFLARPAMGDLRRFARNFGDVILRLPTIRARRGFGAVRAKLSELLADLDLLELDKPRGVLQVLERRQLRRWFTHPGFAASLSSRGPDGDYARTLLIAQVNNVYLRPSARRVFEKSSEHFDDARPRPR